MNVTEYRKENQMFEINFVSHEKKNLNSYIDVIYPDLDVNVLMMLAKWYITRFL
jgi:hypothetical protein